MNQTASSFLALLGHGASNGVTEVCIWEGKSPSHVGYFDDPAKALQAIKQWDGKTNVFVSLNPCKRDLLARANNRLKQLSYKDSQRTKDTEIFCDSWFFIDIDPRRPSGISSTDAEFAAAAEVGISVRDWLVSVGVPAQAIVTALSGNGCYVLVRLPDYPLTDDNKAINQAFLNRIADLFDTAAVEIDRNVFNPARLCCAIGTRKMKGEDISERPHRISSLGTIGGEKFDPATQQTVPPFDLYALAARPLPKPEEPSRKGQQGKDWAGSFDRRQHTDKLHNEKTTSRGYVYYDCPACGGAQKLHINETTGAYGCWHKCTAEAIRAAMGLARESLPDRSRTSSPAATPEPLAVSVVCMADVQAEEVEWLWYPYIPKRKITLMTGQEGIGKSWLTCAIVSAITNGKGLPETDFVEQGNVLMLSAEDGLADTVKPRLVAAEADCSRVFAPQDKFTFDESGLLSLSEMIATYRPLLVVIDPLFAYTGAKVDINKANEARAISTRLADIAEKLDTSLLLIRHFNKAKGHGDSRQAGMSSIDWRAAARVELLVGIDPDNPAQRAIIHDKHNLSEKGKSLGFTIRDGQFFWTGESELTAARILSMGGSEEDVQGRNDAEDFLREVLRAGAKPAKEVLQEAKAFGLTDYQLRSARAWLRIKPFKRGGISAATRAGFGRCLKTLKMRSWRLKMRKKIKLRIFSKITATKAVMAMV
ncbi:MAG: AAA family ATPase [Acidobacteria bacterium]|nr:AAA family ATPase [Acidobacteriota bacterium]